MSTPTPEQMVKAALIATDCGVADEFEAKILAAEVRRPQRDLELANKEHAVASQALNDATFDAAHNTDNLRADPAARDRTIEIERNARVAACAHAEEEKQRAETAEAALAARDEIIRNMENGAKQGAAESREYIARLEKDVAQLREGVATRDATIAGLVKAGDELAKVLTLWDTASGPETAAWDAAKSAAPVSQELAELREVISDARRVSIFEKHPFRPWHARADELLNAARKEGGK